MSDTKNIASPPGFHSIRVSGDERGNVLTVVDFAHGADVTRDPQFLGDPPLVDAGGICSHCDSPGRAHQLDGVVVSVRAFHHFEFSPAGGYYSDELEAFQR